MYDFLNSGCVPKKFYHLTFFSIDACGDMILLNEYCMAWELSVESKIVIFCKRGPYDEKLVFRDKNLGLFRSFTYLDIVFKCTIKNTSPETKT